jgi:hypothetical protein
MITSASKPLSEGAPQMNNNEMLTRQVQAVAEALTKYFAQINKTDIETAREFIALNWNTPAVAQMVQLGFAASIVAANE